MATYYNGGSELQGTDGLQTLVLMNPGYVYYSDSQQSTQPSAENFMFLEHSDHPGNNQINNHHQEANMTAQTQQFVGIPLSASPPSSFHSQHDVSSLHTFIPRAQYMYNPVEMVAREVTPFQQGLSLSLSSQQSRFGSQTAGNSRSPIVTWSHATGVTISPSSGDGRADTPDGGDGGSTSSPSRAFNSVNGMHAMLLNSKYLKATQEILEEVVNVGKVALKHSVQSTKNVNIGGGGDAGSVSVSPPSPITREGEATKSSGGNELTTAERQEIQMKKAKLVNMLDEVEQRYRRYHHQMQIVISWFEQAAGIGSAKTYTALALQTISKQCRCLKDAITGQIKAASRSLGEEDSLSKADGGGSRLKFVDNQLRQQRALQQLGMIQNNAWRPQRGLPERSVSVLRAWLFEHFLHPYPKDSDKLMLAKQTGLTRSQVSNWFINARVRLWKPMVEEMYLEEIKEQQQPNQKEDRKSTEIDDNNNSSSKQGNTLSSENINRAFRPTKQEPSFNPTTTRTQFQFQNQNQNQNPSSFNLTGPLETDGITQFSPKKPRNNFIGELDGYSIGEIGNQFRQQYSGNGVSLTLGLPDCENLSISGSHQRFVPNQSMQLRRGAELGENDYAGMNPPAAVYDSINIESRKRFAAQPLPDFVA